MKWPLLLIGGGLVAFGIFGVPAPAAALEAFPMMTRRMDRAGVVEIVRRLNETEFDGWFEDLADVMAIIEIESGFDAGAYRAEPQISDASHGLMQILETTARDRGFTGAVAELADPETNIRFGMKQMIWNWDYLSQRKAGGVSEVEWIGAYNAGVGNVMKGFIPLTYVERWRVARERWRGQIYG